MDFEKHFNLLNQFVKEIESMIEKKTFRHLKATNKYAS